MKNSHILIISFIALALVISCSKEVTEPDNTITARSTTISNLPADTGKTGHFTFFRLSDSSFVSLADSNTTKWDLGFAGTTIIINSGVRGPGQGAAIVLRQTDYNSLAEAPETGWITETQLAPPAIPTGSDNGWYHYDGAAQTITAIPGVVLLIRTADGKYAKMQIISYYKDAPQVIDPNGQTRMYTFRYVYQANGTKKFQ
ncbi:MAG: HmuY family protein [Bacteroidetes bacterium]|nr:HmuY family protein [Bacteroidota bacterium]